MKRADFYWPIGISVLAGASNLSFAFTVKWLVELASGRSALGAAQVVFLSTGLLGLTLLIQYLRDLALAKLLYQRSLKLRTAIFHVALRSLGVSSVDYLSVLNNDVKTVRTEYYKGLMDLVMYLVMFLCAWSMLLFLNLVHGLMILGLALLAMHLSSYAKAKLQEGRLGISKAQEAYTSRSKDLLLGVDVLRQFQASQEGAKVHDDANLAMEEAERRYAWQMARVGAQSTFVSMLIFFFSYIFGAFLVGRQIYTVATMMMAIQLVNNIVIPVRVSIQTVSSIRGAKAVLDKIEGLIEEEGQAPQSRSKRFTFQSLELQGLSFAYGDTLVLKELDLRFEAGKRYAILGESGSGKSTLLKLLSAQLRPDSGQILLNGEKLESYSPEERGQCLAYMGQEVFLFEDSIRQNVSVFGRQKEDRIPEVLEQSAMEDFVASAGLDFQIAAQGQNLSGGERQRLALARALLADAEVLLLDEAFSALDPKTSQLILDRLLQGGQTLIAVMHQWEDAWLAQFDACIVLDDGRLGSPKSLQGKG